MNGINLQGFEVRSFMIGGLTAKWGIGENRVPPIWDNNLIGYWDARDLPNGTVSGIANKATLATKAPDLIVNGATMADGTLQFDGVNNRSTTSNFTMPEKFTVFWDIDWLGDVDTGAGIIHGLNLLVYNLKAAEALRIYIRNAPGTIPNTNVGISTNGNTYARDGSSTPFGGVVGTGASSATLTIAKRSTEFTQLGFRQLLIFNKELSPEEINEVLTTMFPV